MQTVKIRLRKPTRVFSFLSPDNLTLRRHDNCIVRSDRGLEFGTCVLPPEPCPEHMEARYPMTVVRKATHNDESTFRQIQIEEQKAREIGARKIAERDMPMKLVDVEYTFDRHKVIFYFTAADRVDFRDLVRDLAHDLKTRIELRHIQVRDEAKIVGGLGVCGRELCCSTWLREFMPISMKMAKRQNLSLNPSKISGQCGRLLCCLSYENELYKEAKKRDKDREAAQKAMLEAQARAEEEEGLIVPTDTDEDYPWQKEPYEEVASVVTDERIHGRLPNVEDEDAHASNVVEIDSDESDEEVVEVPEAGTEVTIVRLPHGSPGSSSGEHGANGVKRKRRRRRRRRKPSDGGNGGSEGDPSDS